MAQKPLEATTPDIGHRDTAPPGTLIWATLRPFAFPQMSEDMRLISDFLIREWRWFCKADLFQVLLLTVLLVGLSRISRLSDCRC